MNRHRWLIPIYLLLELPLQTAAALTDSPFLGYGPMKNNPKAIRLAERTTIQNPYKPSSNEYGQFEAARFHKKQSAKSNAARNGRRK